MRRPSRVYDVAAAQRIELERLAIRQADNTERGIRIKAREC